MIGGLDNVIHRHSLLIFETYGACFKDIASLFLGEFAALNAIRVVSQLHLGLMIKSALKVCLLLVDEKCSKFDFSYDELSKVTTKKRKPVEFEVKSHIMNILHDYSVIHYLTRF